MPNRLDFLSRTESCNEDDCVIWEGRVNNKWYGMVSLNLKDRLIHRLSYCNHNHVSLGSITGLVVRHKCDTPRCFNPLHLEIGTQLENIQDTVKRGRTPKGERNGMSKLTTELVAKIRAMYVPKSKDLNCYTLAKLFSVSPMTINLIVNNKVWSN